jgi:DNA-directed RNA polymerase subunit M/transcription elongation factor TFIIS
MNKKSLRALADFGHEVERHATAGHQAFVVSIYLMAGGIGRYKMAQIEEAAQQLLLDMGLGVTGMERRDWEYKTYFEVQVPQARDPEKRCPRCAEMIKAAALVCRYCGAEFPDTPAIDDVVVITPTRPHQSATEMDLDLDTDADVDEVAENRQHIGPLMCPRFTCDEAGFRTEDERCDACGSKTVSWE